MNDDPDTGKYQSASKCAKAIEKFVINEQIDENTTLDPNLYFKILDSIEEPYHSILSIGEDSCCCQIL